MKKILVIEDDPLKRRLIKEYLMSLIDNSLIQTESSYNTGMRALQSTAYDLLILDMSMPTFSDEIFDSESSFEKFAGIMILKELKRKAKLLPTILFTMFDDFGSRDFSISLKQVDEGLRNEFGIDYWGYVFFESASTNWKNQINKILDDKNFNPR